MDFSSLPLFSIMKGKLGYLSQRQGVLAQNVANADTPGYQAQDVAAPDFKSMAQGSARTPGGNLKMAVTAPGHLTGMGSSNGAVYATQNRLSTYERNPNGNNVSVEEEMMLMAGNQADYQKVLNLYKKTTDLFKVALGKPGGQ